MAPVTEVIVPNARGRRSVGVLFLATLFVSGAAAPRGGAGPLDELSVERWAKLREAERFQLAQAEKFYTAKQYKVAADEYEKFLKLYENSEGAAYAQLKWSHCQVSQRKLNTAIKDGYQSVLDYFPESPEAPLATYLIGHTYKAMGELKAAKKGYDKAIQTYPKHFVAVMARMDLVEIADKEKDASRRAALLRELTFDVERKGQAVSRQCVDASELYAQYCFAGGDFAEGLKALATSYSADSLPAHLMHHQQGRLAAVVSSLTGATDAETKAKGDRLADAAVAWLKGQAAEDVKDVKRKDRGISCWYAAADVQAAARRPEKQREVYDQMLAALGPTDALLGRLAQWYKDAKQRDKARETYAKFADAVEGQNQTAASYIEEGKFDPAVEIYRKLAVQDAKNSAKWMSSVAYTYRRAGKADPAIAVYRELLTADATNANRWHWEIADTLYDFGRWKEAIAAFRGTDRFPESYQRMAHAHRQLKQYDEAIGLYQQIIAAAPGSAAWAQLQIGYTHEQAGRVDSAVKAFKTVCDRFPKSGEGSTAHAHLNNKYKITVTLGGAKD